MYFSSYVTRLMQFYLSVVLNTLMPLLKLGDRFESWKDLSYQVDRHGKDTKQVFVTAEGNAKTTANNPLHDCFAVQLCHLVL